MGIKFPDPVESVDFNGYCGIFRQPRPLPQRLKGCRLLME